MHLLGRTSGRHGKIGLHACFEMAFDIAEQEIIAGSEFDLELTILAGLQIGNFTQTFEL